jgi:hypothetical protein
MTNMGSGDIEATLSTSLTDTQIATRMAKNSTNENIVEDLCSRTTETRQQESAQN